MLASNLQIIAAKLKKMPFFVGTNDLDRMLYKQLLFLVVAGIKPVCQVSAAYWQATTKGGVAKPYERRVIASALEELGLVYHLQSDRHTLLVTASKEIAFVEKLLNTTDDIEAGKLFGYPATAIAAFPTRDQDCLSIEDQDAILFRLDPAHQFYNLPCFRMSKQHYRMELKAIECWLHVLRQYDLLTTD